MNLYERIGGAAGLTRLLDGLYARAVPDPVLSPSLLGVDLECLKARQHLFIAQAAGGPQHYSGPSLEQAHAGLRIGTIQFEAFVKHLRETLQDLGMPPDVIEEFMLRVNSLQGVIINASSGA